MTNALRLEAIGKEFVQAGNVLPILSGVDLKVGAGEVVALLGPSGSGKTTLLQIAGLLAAPDRGRVWIGEKACEALGDRDRTATRRRGIGFVYQFHHLLPELSAEENVAMPLMLQGMAPHLARVEAERLLVKVGLDRRLEHRPSELSGGEKQRVAIARALVAKPGLLLADEPTGNLDPETGVKVFDVLREQLRESKAAALIVTHNLDIAGRCDRTVRLVGGKVVV